MPRTSFYRRENIPFQPNIGLDAGIRQSVVELLNLILADESVLLLKTQRTDGHTDRVNNSELQLLYDDQCKQIAVISNEIVERVQILSGSPLRGSEDKIEQARLGGELNTVPGIVNILANHESFIRFLREDARKCSELYEDQGTFALLVNILRSHEKMAWILRSNIGLEQYDDEK